MTVNRTDLYFCNFLAPVPSNQIFLHLHVYPHLYFIISRNIVYNRFSLVGGTFFVIRLFLCFTESVFYSRSKVVVDGSQQCYPFTFYTVTIVPTSNTRSDCLSYPNMKIVTRSMKTENDRLVFVSDYDPGNLPW